MTVAAPTIGALRAPVPPDPCAGCGSLLDDGRCRAMDNGRGGLSSAAQAIGDWLCSLAGPCPSRREALPPKPRAPGLRPPPQRPAMLPLFPGVAR